MKVPLIVLDLNTKVDTIANLKLQRDTIAILIITEEQFRKNVRSNKFFFSAHCLNIVYICTKFQENILIGFRIMERTLFQ